MQLFPIYDGTFSSGILMCFLVYARQMFIFTTITVLGLQVSIKKKEVV